MELTTRDYKVSSMATPTRERNELRVIMVGRTGGGKSAVGNSLLGHRGFFESDVASGSITSTCSAGHLDMQNGKRLVVVDTPGLFDTRMDNDEISKELVRCIALSCPGPHAFLIVMSVDRFTKEEWDTIEYLQKLFGADVTKFAIFVFTGKDTLEFHGTTLEEHIDKSPPKLQSLIDRCGGRMTTINNRVPPGSNDDDVNKILSLVEQLRHSNDVEHYTNEMFEAADKIFQDQLRQKIAEFSENDKRRIELELREQIRTEIDKNDGILVTYFKGVEKTTGKIAEKCTIQ